MGHRQNDMTSMQLPAGARGTVQVWGKGFKVSLDSEEFQRLVPANDVAPAGLDATLPFQSWGVVTIFRKNRGSLLSAGSRHG
jgi:hypothetical protein